MQAMTLDSHPLRDNYHPSNNLRILFSEFSAADGIDFVMQFAGMNFYKISHVYLQRVTVSLNPENLYEAGAGIKRSMPASCASALPCKDSQ